MLSLRDNSTTVSLMVWSAMSISIPDMAGVTWSYSPIITSRRTTATSTIIAFICKGHTEACYIGCHVWLRLPERRPLACSIFSARMQSFSIPSQGGQVTVPPQTHPCLFSFLLTLQPRHHICLRSCLALLLKAVALSDKLSVEGKKGGDSATHPWSEHPLVLLTPLSFKH